MFWPHDPEAQGNALPKPWPVYTAVLMGLFVLVYILSLFSQGTEKAIKAAKEKVVCAYLERDYTKLPASTLRLLPKELRRHHKRTAAIMLRYDRDPASAKAQGQAWADKGDWDSASNAKVAGKSCLQQAIDSGQLGQHPKRRLFIALAPLSSHERHKHQRNLDQLVGAYHQARQGHVLYGWGLIGNERRWFTFVTALFVIPSWFVLFWQLLLIWVIGTMLERRWRSPLWLGVYWVAALLGNVVLALLVGKSSSPMVGSGVGVASLVGMWTGAFALKDVTYNYWKPGGAALPKFTFQGWFVTVAWLLLAGVSALIFHPHPISFLIVLFVGIGIGVAALLGIEATGIIVPKITDARESAPLVKGQTYANKRTGPRLTLGTSSRKPPRKAPRTGPRPAAPVSAAPVVNEALLNQLNQQAAEAIAGGNKDGAVQIFRDAAREEKGALWALEGLLVTCEKVAMVAKPEEYLKAIRAAAAAKQKDKTLTFLSLLMRHRKTGAVSLGSRDQLGLATDLKRAGLYEEALVELEDLLQENDDNPYMIKGTLLKAECLQQVGRPPQEAIAILNKLDPVLEKYPEFINVIEQERKRAQQRLGVVAEAPAAKPSGPAVATTKSNAPASLGGAIPGTTESPAQPLPPSISAASDESREIDVSLLEEIEMFEALRAPGGEREPAADSWSELPSLLLHQESEAPTTDAPSMFEAKKEPTGAINRLGGDGGLSAQQRLAEEVTAAFDVSDLQSKLGGSDWGDDSWGEDFESSPDPYDANGYDADFDSLSGPGHASPHNANVDADFDSLPGQAQEAPQPPLPPPTASLQGASLLPIDRVSPALSGGMIPMSRDEVARSQPTGNERRQETMGNYQASLPPLQPIDKPAAKPQPMYETQIGRASLANSAALLPEDEAGSYAPSQPPIGAGTPGAGAPLDLTEEVDDPAK